MRRFFARRPTPAMAVAFVALLAALSGTAVASLPGTNTVDSGDIINSAVRSKDVKNSNLRGKDVKNASLTGRDIDEATLGTVPSATTVVPEAIKADELGATQTVVQGAPINPNGNAEISVACPTGTQALSGGGTTTSYSIVMVSSFQSGNGWIVAYHNNDPNNAGTIYAIATCLNN
jgi:hypothetical protein